MLVVLAIMSVLSVEHSYSSKLTLQIKKLVLEHSTLYSDFFSIKRWLKKINVNYAKLKRDTLLFILQCHTTVCVTTITIKMKMVEASDMPIFFSQMKKKRGVFWVFFFFFSRPVSSNKSK